MGLNGFDIIHDGEGIPDGELPNVCKSMEMRERNEIYKTKSIGFRGEAFNTLAKSSSLTIITKHSKSPYAWKVEYGRNCSIVNIQQYDEMKNEGTIVQARNIHKNNEDHRKRFFSSIKTTYDSTIGLLNSWSYIMYNKTLLITSSLKAEDV